MARIRKLLQVLKTRFKTRLYEAIEGGGPVTLYIDGENIYAKNCDRAICSASSTTPPSR